MRVSRFLGARFGFRSLLAPDLSVRVRFGAQETPAAMHSPTWCRVGARRRSLRFPGDTSRHAGPGDLEQPPWLALAPKGVEARYGRQRVAVRRRQWLARTHGMADAREGVSRPWSGLRRLAEAPMEPAVPWKTVRSLAARQTAVSRPATPRAANLVTGAARLPVGRRPVTASAASTRAPPTAGSSSPY